MAKTYILMDGKGMAAVVSEKSVEKEVLRRLAKGEKVRVFEGSEVKVAFTLELGGAAEAPVRKTRKKRRKKRAKKTGKKTTAKKAAGKKAAKKTRKKAGKKTSLGRPKVNVGPCSVEGCENEQRTKGLCSKHYQANRRLVAAGEKGLI